MRFNTVLFIDATKLPQGAADDYFRELDVSLSALVDTVVYGLREKLTVPVSATFLNDRTVRQAFELTFELSSASRSALLYVRAPLLPNDAMLLGLHESLEIDALFGAAIPRFSDPATDNIWLLPKDGEMSEPSLSRKGLAALPDFWVISEIPVACCLIRRSVVDSFPPMEDYGGTEGALVHLLCAIRRRSFRPVISNRVVLPVSLKSGELFPKLILTDSKVFSETVFSRFTFPQVDGDGADYFTHAFPSCDSVSDWWLELPFHRLERLLAAAYPAFGRRRSVVIDCRGMFAHFCGTTVAQLGFLDGFQSLSGDWDIHVWAQDFAIRAHGLVERFPGLRISTEPEGFHAAVIHMNQLCFSGILCDLHRHGFLTASNILDTIAWDMILGAPAHVGRVWNLDAEYLDILFYISNFSKSQFNRRFPVARGVMESISYLSFARSENVVAAFEDRAVGDHVLVFGNNYDHKDVYPTVQRIHASFPSLTIVAIGPECESIDGVTFLPSGDLPDSQIEELVASARVVVFPSWNEGFGLPVVKALAYGRPVVVRDLPLWHEIAEHTDLPGVLMSFDDTNSLNEVLNAVLRGKVTRVLPQGRLIAEKPLDWKGCAQRLLEAVEQRLERADATQWMRRERLVRMLEA